MDRYWLSEKIKEYHKNQDKGQIPVYENVIILQETITVLGDKDVDAVALVLHDGDSLEKIIHLEVGAAFALMVGLQELFDDEESDESDEFELD